MTDTATEATADAPTPEPAPDTGPDLAAEVEKWKTLARKHEERAKANGDAAKELDKFRQQSMSDTEKAIDEARKQARTEALKEAAGKVAAASIRAAATGRFDVTAELLEGINLAAFVDDDGEVDEAKVAKFVDSIAPKADDTPAPVTPLVDLGQGQRTGSQMALNGDPLLRAVKDKLGVK